MKIIYFFGIVLILTACSKEPSQDEVYAAIDTKLRNDFSKITDKKIFGISAANISGINAITIKNIEKINCTSGEQNIASCEVLVDYSYDVTEESLLKLIGGTGQNRSVRKYKFIKTSQGWSQIDEQ
jgi:hypothetical protein